MELNYKNLYFDGTAWSDESIAIIKDMLEVWDTDHRILICHPNCIFSTKPVSKNNQDFSTIEWENLSDKFSNNEDNSFIGFPFDCDEAFKYIHRRFRHELFKTELQQPRHLVVVEQDSLGGNLVRGIFKATEDEFMVAENPLYTKYKPTSIWNKYLRLDADKCDSLSEFIKKNSTKDEPTFN